eukprot:2075515-Prymnesium_polylepis.1
MRSTPLPTGWSEALHGVQAGCAESEASTSPHCPINFPAAISTAASFNKTLFAQVGAVIDTEARALWNEGVTNGLTFCESKRTLRMRDAFSAPSDSSSEL